MKNNLMRKFCLLLALVLGLSVLVACSDDEGEVDLASMPRYDYLANDILPYVTLDPSVYAAMQLTIPTKYEITDKVVEDYINSLRFNKRVPETVTESETENVTENVTESVTEGVTESVTEGVTEKETEKATAIETETVKMTDRPMKEGDSAFIYYRGELNGEEFEGGSNWSSNEPYELALGSNSFIDGFEDGLIGIIPNQTSRDEPYALHVTFPETYGSTDLAGKAVIFYVFVEYAVPYELPAFDRTFVLETMKYEAEKEAYADDEELLDEYRAYIRATLEQDIADEVKTAKADALWYFLLEKATFKNHPEEEMDYYTALYEQDVKSAYDYYSGYGGESFTKNYPTVEDFAKAYLGLKEGEDLAGKLQEMAKTLVERDMVIHAIGEQEGIETVTEAEFDAEIRYYIDYYKQNGNITKTREDIIEELGGENNIRLTAFKIKMESWLLERATFTYKD